MLRKSIMFFVITGFFVITTNAHAALNAYLYITGAKQGQVKGSVTQMGRENSIQVIAFEQITKMEMGAATGVAGRRNVGPIVITKEVDKSSPVLRQMLNTNEIIIEATIKFWTPSVSTGKEINDYTVKLTQARIVSMKTVMANNKIPTNMQLREYEEITIIYGRAEWTWVDGGITTLEDAPLPSLSR
jgi:type VI secretion system secreted protein Hcp